MDVWFGICVSRHCDVGPLTAASRMFSGRRPCYPGVYLFCDRRPHAGLSPDLQSMEQIRRIMRPTDVPDQGLLCDLLWSDPDKDVLGWGENDRGVSFTFGSEVVAKFLHKHDLDLICRAHQVITATSVIR